MAFRSVSTSRLSSRADPFATIPVQRCGAPFPPPESFGELAPRKGDGSRATLTTVCGWEVSVGYSGGGKQRAGGLAFGGRLQAKHQASPGGIAGDKVICFVLPASVREMKQSSRSVLNQAKQESRVLPLLPALAEPFYFCGNNRSDQLKPVDRGTVKEAQLCGSTRFVLRDVGRPPFREPFTRGNQRVDPVGRGIDQEGVFDVRHLVLLLALVRMRAYLLTS